MKDYTQVLLVVIAFLNGGALTMTMYFIRKNDRDHEKLFGLLWELKNGRVGK